MCSGPKIDNISTDDIVMMKNNFNDNDNDKLFEQDYNVSSCQQKSDISNDITKRIKNMLKNDNVELLKSKKVLEYLQKKAECFQSLDSDNFFIQETNDFIDLPTSSQSQSTIENEQPKKEVLFDKSLKSTTCEICNLTFASVQSKVRHVGRIHPTEVDKIKTTYMKSILPNECQICKKAFATAAALRNHKRRHDETLERFPCKFCNRSYIIMSELRKHIKRAHSANSTSTSRPSSCSTTDDCYNMPEI